jgi:hypothetical protein
LKGYAAKWWALNHLWTESQSTYYATDNSYINSSWGQGVTPATVAGKQIGAVSAQASTSPNEMLKASTNGEVRVEDRKRKSKICGCWLSR